MKNRNLMNTFCEYFIFSSSPDGLREFIFEKKTITYIKKWNDINNKMVLFESKEIMFLNQLPDIVISNLINYITVNNNKIDNDIEFVKKWSYSDSSTNPEYFLEIKKNQENIYNFLIKS